ncbi:MAG: gliding motility-associated C-terminal domain-containing protein, partial [Flavobacteriales bacterium]|nr:gliding motility-associated C-terminal domain-containing protein [Flavobacteriales bacterium]
VQDPTFGYPSDTYCLDGSKITPTISGVAGGFFGASSFSIDIDGSTGEIDLDPVMSGPGTYWIYYMTPGPICPGVDSFEITLLTPDDPSFTYPSPICITGENPFPISVTTPGGTFSEIALLVPFADATTGEIDLSGCTPGDYVIQYATSGVCPDSSTQNITILPAIDSTFWVPDTICQGSPPINLSDSTSIESWETHYFYSYGPLGSADLSGPNMEIFDPEESEAGSYFITHVVDNGVCMDSMTISVTILPDYDATTSIPDTLCAIEGVYDLNTYLIDYTSSSGGVWFGSTIVDDSLWDVSDLGGAFYDIGYTIGFGHCTDTTNYSIYIADDADSNWTDPPLLCRSSEILNLADLITGTEGGTFSGIGVVNDSLFNPFISGTGTHSITYTVGGGSCAESLTKTITILEDPTAYAGVNSESCGLDAQLAATSNSPGIWTASSTAIFSGETDPNSSVDVVEYGTHIFYWSVDQSGVCSAVDSVEITFFEQPIADAGPDQQLNFIFETEMDATIPTGNSGQWKLESGGGNIWNDADMNTSIDQLELGPNQFSWTVENGPCPAHTDEVIIMINSVFIPEAITPNGDGKNDLFEIKGIESHPNTVKIFNRWGQTVYEITNYQNDWGGTDASGNPLPNDTYFYIITIGETLNYNGHLLIKK